jgi:hypothetical protein
MAYHEDIRRQMRVPLAYVLPDLAYHPHTTSELRGERVEGRIDKTGDRDSQREKEREREAESLALYGLS